MSAFTSDKINMKFKVQNKTRLSLNSSKSVKICIQNSHRNRINSSNMATYCIHRKYDLMCKLKS